MSESAKIDEWLTTRYQAYVWWCQDEVCDCTQPRIDKITPNKKAWYPWIHREAIWEGEFLTDTWEYSGEERERLHYAPLREACRAHGVPIPSDLPKIRLAASSTPTGDTET